MFSNRKKGFTLIELLAVIVILGIVMAIAIPGINAVINNTRKNAFISDAKMYADAARTGILGEQFKEPISGTDTIIHINELELEKGGTKSSYGHWWNDGRTYILVRYNGTRNDYYFAGEDEAGNRVLLQKVQDLVSSDVVTTGEITYVYNGDSDSTSTTDISFDGGDAVSTTFYRYGDVPH